MSEAGFADPRTAHAPVFMAIDPGGIRITELADRTRMTEQTAGELVRYPAGHGYLQVGTDDQDRRARRVALTDRGRHAIETGERVINGFGTWLDDAIGAAGVERLRETLDRIITSP